MSWFRFRPAIVSELARCAELVRAQDGDATVLGFERLARLADRRQLIHHVFVEDRADGSSQVWGAGFSVLVGGEVARQAVQGGIDGLVEWLTRPRAAGHGPVLAPAQQTAARQEGDLHAVVLGFAIDPHPACPVSQVQSLAQRAFVHAHSGYGLRSLIGEVDESLSRACDYRASLDAMGCAAAPRRPGSPTQVHYLCAADMARRPYHVLQPVFAPGEPVLRLSPSQRLQAELALLGHGDDEITRLMDVSPETVSKRWAHIFQAVDRHLPGLLWPASDRAVRGPAKRRPLLNYLQSHLHELRP